MSRTFDERDTASFQELEGILPHAEAVISRADASAETTITIATALGRHHRVLGRYAPAKSFFEDALKRAEGSYAAGHPSIATRQSNLATVLRGLGELEEARDLLREALAANERSYAAGHPSIATRQSNLATVLKDLGELEEARDLMRKASVATLDKFGPNHSRTKTHSGTHG